MRRLALSVLAAAPVHHPAWVPDPLVGSIGNRWNSINAVSPDLMQELNNPVLSKTSA